MNFITMNQTDLNVSKFALGTGNYGTSIPEATAIRQMDQFFGSGANFIDTAHVYGDWEPGELAKSEKIIGRYLKKTGKRHDAVISTKGAHPKLETMHISRVTPNDIRIDLEESLQALQTDYIDLYFLHRDNTAIPAAELIGTLEEARQQGKIRWYGCSNWSLERIREADETAKTDGLSGFICNQLMWSLADINASAIWDKTLNFMDIPTWQYHLQTGKSAMCYTSMANGYLSKKLSQTPLHPAHSAKYTNPQNDQILSIIKKSGLPAGAVSLAYLMAQPFSTVPIAAFRTDAQLAEAIKSCDFVLPQDMFAAFQNIKKHSS